MGDQDGFPFPLCLKTGRHYMIFVTKAQFYEEWLMY